MPTHETFFWAAFFFLIGTLIASATTAFPTTTLRLEFIGIASLLSIAGLRLLKKGYASLACIVFIGGAYCITYDINRQAKHIPFGRETKIEGIITQAEEHLDYQELRLADNLVITTDRYPAFAYGDHIALTGTVRKSKSPLVRGYVTARHTNITIIGHHEGSTLKERLYDSKTAFENNLKKVLPSEKAAFLSGLTVGSTAEFTKEFISELRTTGTTHLVALSGSNISGIISVLMLILTWFLPRKKTFWPALAVIIVFVVMTGAEASLVRAAIMNGIALAGSYYERMGSMRNAIIAAAFLMALWNPLVPAFDLGFQLSFAAILGMAYIEPIIKKHTRLTNKEALQAISAQAAVMPVLALTIHHANPVSIIPNLLIAMVIPTTVGLGFLTGALGFVSTTVSFAPAWIANVLLSYEMGVVHIFARYM